MRIIIAGSGKVGSLLTQRLLSDGHEIVLIDIKANVVQACADKFDVITIEGNCASAEILDEADVRQADMVIAVTAADEINMLCCLCASGMNPNVQTIARIRNPEYLEQIFMLRDIYGIKYVVNPERQAAVEIERIIRYPGFLRRDTFARGRVEMVELKVKPDSKLNNLVLSKLNSTIKCKVLVVAVRRAGVVYAPDGNFELREGDRIYVTAPTDELTTLLNGIGIMTQKAREVILCGGGKVGYYLAHELSNAGIDVNLIERKRDRCEFLAERLPKVSVIHGDASSQEFLMTEHIDKADAVISVTSYDEVNMIISLFAQTLNVDQVVTKIDHAINTKIQDALNIGSVVSPKDVCATQIVRYVRSIESSKGAALTMRTFANDQMEILEFLVEEDTRHQGESLKDVRTKKNVLIACISHGRSVEIASGDSTFSKGDTMVVVSNVESRIRTINDIFA